MKTKYKDQILNLLEKYNIEYWTSGKNVSVGSSVNIRCCFCDDHSNHLGIFYETMCYNCWKCGASGHLSWLLVKLLDLSIEQAQAMTDTPVDFKKEAVDQIEAIFESAQDEIEEKEWEDAILPPFFEPIMESTEFHLLNQYMQGRRKKNGTYGRSIARGTLIKHQCGICRAGPMMNRLVIPILFDGELIGYQGADLTGRATLKYRTSKTPVKEYLYNYDNITGRTMIVTEGVLDCWRVGHDAVATFGTTLIDEQRQLIIDKNLDTLIWVWDGDAYWKTVKEAAYFRPLFPSVKIAELPDGEDPDSLGYEAVWQYINKASEAF